MELEKILNGRTDLAVDVAKVTGKFLIKNFGRLVNIKAKGDRNLVSSVDIEADEKIVKSIKDNYPKDDILSEEGQHPFRGSDFRWIIDPLDGTHNYLKSIDIFGVSIAIEFKGEVVVGVIYMPVTQELYLAEKGKGSHLNGKEIKVSKRNLKESTVVYDSSIRYDKKVMLDNLCKIAERAFNIRMFGSTARSLSYLAEGKVDLEVEFSDKVWDFAAGLLLVEEAGGRATDFAGKKWSTQTKKYIASNGNVHDEVLQLIEGSA